MDLILIPKGPAPFENRQDPPIRIDYPEDLLLPIPYSYYRPPLTATEATPAVAFVPVLSRPRLPPPPPPHLPLPRQSSLSTNADPVTWEYSAEAQLIDTTAPQVSPSPDPIQTEIVAEPQLRDLKKEATIFKPQALMRKRKAVVPIKSENGVESATELKSAGPSSAPLKEKEEPKIEQAPVVKKPKIEINLFAGNPLLNVLKKRTTQPAPPQQPSKLDKEYEDFKNELKDLL